MPRIYRGELGDAVARAVAGGRATGPILPESFTGQVAAILDAHGGNKAAAARAVGVPRKTFADWAAGRGVTRGVRGDRAASVARVATIAARRARLSPTRERQLRRMHSGRPPGWPDFRIKGLVQVSSQVVDREIRPGAYMPPGAMRDVVDAYLRGDDMSGAIHEMIQSHYVDDMSFPGGEYEVNF